MFTPNSITVYIHLSFILNFVVTLRIIIKKNQRSLTVYSYGVVWGSVAFLCNVGQRQSQTST